MEVERISDLRPDSPYRVDEHRARLGHDLALAVDLVDRSLESDVREPLMGVLERQRPGRSAISPAIDSVPCEIVRVNTHVVPLAIATLVMPPTLT